MSDPKAANGAPRRPRVLIVHNPTAGGSRARAGATIVRLRRLGCHLEVRSTARRGDAEAFARAAAGQGFDRVVAAGGDGTINEAIQGLAGTGLPLALLPLCKTLIATSRPSVRSLALYTSPMPPEPSSERTS